MMFANSSQFLHRGSRGDAKRFSLEAALAVGLLGIWFLLRPYSGIYGDALIYVTRVIADADPKGIGRDWMFTMDRQTQYSLFPVLMRFAVDWLGSSLAGQTVAFLGLLFWFASAFALAQQLLTGRARWLFLALVAILPHASSGFNLLPYGEPSATPRPFAEALTLLAFTAVLRERFFASAALLAVAALLHPIMALPGVSVLFVMLCRRDLRWLYLAPAVALGLAAAALLGLPLAHRLTQFVDPEWKAALDVRNNYLFPRLWDGASLATLALRLAILLIGAQSAAGRVRVFFLAIAGVSLGGIVIAELFGDLIPNLLIVQVQVWRAAWIAAVFAPAAFAMFIVKSASEKPSAWVVPALLALAWAPIAPPDRFVAISLAVALDFLSRRGLIALSDSLSRGLTLVIVGLGALVVFYNLAELISFAEQGPDGIIATRDRLFMMNTHVWPLALAAVVVALGASPERDRSALMALSAALGALAIVGWDSRNDFIRFFDRQTTIPEFSATIATKAGEVYWAHGSIEAWYGLGRPNWLTSIQGAGIVFSRDETFFWKDRAERAVALGFESRKMIQPFGLNTAQAEPTIDASRLRKFCANVDAPAWVVWPLHDNEAPPSDLHPRAIWRSPLSFADFVGKDGAYRWERKTDFMLLPCRNGTAS